MSHYSDYFVRADFDLLDRGMEVSNIPVSPRTSLSRLFTSFSDLLLLRKQRRYFHVDDGRLTDILELLRVDARGDGGGMIDYISFSQLFTPYTLPSFTSRCRDVGPLALATPTDEEVALLGRTSERLHGLAEEAARCGTRLLIDAEHTKYQPAIDNLVLELQRKYNAADRPVVFNTYQVSVCY